MQPGARLAALIELVDSTLEEWRADSPRPADLLLKRYTQPRRYIGSGDRRALTESYFTLLRHFGELVHQCRATGLLETGRSLALLEQSRRGSTESELDALCTGTAHHPPPVTEQERLALTIAFATNLPFAARHNLPDWLANRLVADWGDEAEALCGALQQPAALDLRINPRRTTLDAARKALANAGIDAVPIAGLDFGLTIAVPAPIQHLPLYRQGGIEIQDRGSQAICQSLAQLKPTRILDLCAGGGGKSLALAAHLGSECTIVATDIHARRLAELAPRAARAGADITTLPHDKAIALAEPFDLVLCDVPCSGTGTLRRHPDLAWRLTPARVAEYESLQRRILVDASRRVAANGVLAYVTCSLLDSENQCQIANFVQSHSDYKQISTRHIWEIDASLRKLYVRMAPHRTQSDGFFAAWLQRVS